MAIPIPHRCPRCGGGIPNSAHPGAYPGALSRWDNQTEVCSGCGSDEAMAQYAAALRAGDKRVAVHPVHGTRKWVTPPEAAK